MVQMIQTFSMLLVPDSEIKIPEAKGHKFGFLFWFGCFVCLFVILFDLVYVVFGFLWYFYSFGFFGFVLALFFCLFFNLY